MLPHRVLAARRALIEKGLRVAGLFADAPLGPRLLDALRRFVTPDRCVG